MSSPAPVFAERRRAERAFADLQIDLARLPSASFYQSLIDRLSSLLQVECAFIAHLSMDPEPRLHALAFRSEGPFKPPPPTGCTLAALPLPDLEQLRNPTFDLTPWLRQCSCLRDWPDAKMQAHPLLACDGSLIGVIAIASRGPVLPHRAHVRNSLATFGRLAERVLEREEAVRATQHDRAVLRRSEEFFRSMFDAMSEGVAVHEFVFDRGSVADYRILDVNAAFERHTGIRATKARGRLASTLYGTQPAPFLQRYAAFAAGSRPIAFETYFEPLRRRLRISAFALGSRKFVTVFQDVTEQRRLEKEDRERALELARTGGILTLGEMASTLAHELNQPLTSIANFSAGSLARIQNGTVGLDSLATILAEIGEEAERAGRILNGVRRFIQRRDLVPAPTDLDELIEEVVGLAGTLNRDDQAVVRADVDPALPQVMADRVLMQVVLMNLIRNGLEAMEGTADGLKELRVGALASGASQVEVQVSDQGCGLPPQDADEVFRAFFTTKRDGLGLGLAIARSIVESHGGRIWATRNIGPGSTFHFTLSAIVPATVTA